MPNLAIDTPDGVAASVQRAENQFDPSLWVPSLVYLTALLLVRPWGEFPLNDDWQYAHTAKQLAATGIFHVDVPVAPTLVLQSFLGAGVIRMLGFSHLGLRLLTLTLGLLLLLLMRSLLKLGGVPAPIRLLTLLVLALNPIFLSLSASFMTEIYGFIPALTGTILWLANRRRQLATGGWSHGRACLAAFMIASSFWVRQLCVVFFPALTGAALVCDLLERDRDAMRRDIGRFALPALVFALVIAAYFHWAHTTGNLTVQFTSPVKHLTEWDFPQLVIQPVVTVDYLTFFLLPMLALFHSAWRKEEWPSPTVTAGTTLLWATSVYFTFQRGRRKCGPVTHLCSYFPQLGNVMSPQAVGPLTLSDTYFSPRVIGRPSVVDLACLCIQFLLLVLPLIWLPLLRVSVRLVADRHAHRLEREALAVGWLLLAANTILLARSFGGQVFDRYHITTLLAGLLVGSVITGLELRQRKLQSVAVLALAALLLPVSFYSIAGLHDYFRWNEARWELYRSLRQKGISGAMIDGGWEINGWNHFESDAPPTDCGAAEAWFCPHRPYRLSMRPAREYRVLDSRPISTWLRPMPPILALGPPPQGARR